MINWTKIIDTLMEEKGYTYEQVFENYNLEQMLDEYGRLEVEA